MKSQHERVAIRTHSQRHWSGDVSLTHDIDEKPLMESGLVSKGFGVEQDAYFRALLGSSMTASASGKCIFGPLSRSFWRHL